MVTQKAEKLPYEAEKSYYREQLRPCCFELDPAHVRDQYAGLSLTMLLHLMNSISCMFGLFVLAFVLLIVVQLDWMSHLESLVFSIRIGLDFVNFSFEYNETIVAFQVGWVIQVLRITGAIFNNWEIFYFNSMGPLSKGLSRASVGSITMVFWFLEPIRIGIFIADG